ncbi:hypothetical protein MMMDOFMJ_1095 [Methylobacterium gnaphalii]|nr:hypothetical protein MMMDOFMJ_1095 [Methylobacterium gnaphalii]
MSEGKCCLTRLCMRPAALDTCPTGRFQGRHSISIAVRHTRSCSSPDDLHRRLPERRSGCRLPGHQSSRHWRTYGHAHGSGLEKSDGSQGLQLEQPARREHRARLRHRQRQHHRRHGADSPYAVDWRQRDGQQHPNRRRNGRDRFDGHHLRRRHGPRGDHGWRKRPLCLHDPRLSDGTHNLSARATDLSSMSVCPRRPQRCGSIRWHRRRRSWRPEPG